MFRSHDQKSRSNFWFFEIKSKYCPLYIYKELWPLCLILVVNKQWFKGIDEPNWSYSGQKSCCWPWTICCCLDIWGHLCLIHETTNLIDTRTEVWHGECFSTVWRLRSIVRSNSNSCSYNSMMSTQYLTTPLLGSFKKLPKWIEMFLNYIHKFIRCVFKVNIFLIQMLKFLYFQKS